MRRSKKFGAARLGHVRNCRDESSAPLQKAQIKGDSSPQEESHEASENVRSTAKVFWKKAPPGTRKQSASADS